MEFVYNVTAAYHKFFNFTAVAFKSIVTFC